MADQQSFEQQLAAALAAAGGGILGKSLGGNGGGNVPPQLGQLLDMSVQQNAYQNPLRQAVTQGAYGMLPTFMREGTQLTGGLSNAIPAAGNYGGGGGGVNKAGVAGGAGLAALAGLLGKNGAGGSMDLGKIFGWIKSKFGHGQSVQGNQPYGGGALGSGNPGTFGGFEGWDPSVSDPHGNPFLTSDPGSWYDASGSGAYPTDPSGGSGVGPGMQDYYSNSDETV